MRERCDVKLFIQSIRLGDAAADTLSKFAIRKRKFGKRLWAEFITITQRINMNLLMLKLEMSIGKYNELYIMKKKKKITLIVKLMIRKTEIWEQ